MWMGTLAHHRQLRIGPNLPTLELILAGLLTGCVLVDNKAPQIALAVCVTIIFADSLRRLTVIPWELVNVHDVAGAAKRANDLVKYALAAETTIAELRACDGSKKALKAVIEKSKIKPPASIMDEDGEYWDGFHDKEQFISWYKGIEFSAKEQLVRSMEENVRWHRRQLRVLGCLYKKPKEVVKKPTAPVQAAPKRRKIPVVKEAPAIALQKAIANFGMELQFAGQPVVGPSVTRYTFAMPEGVKLSKLLNLADDIALAMGVKAVSIATIPGQQSVVGIDVPNARPTPVLLQDVVRSREFQRSTSPVTFALGRDIHGNAIVDSINRLPHVLIAGTTGSGKSVCMNTLICSMLLKSGPDRVKFIMIDPKMVELSPYNGIPHLIRPVVTEPEEAAKALMWAVAEMDARYKRLMDAGEREIEAYNKGKRNKMPYIVIIIDELADLMMVAKSKRKSKDDEGDEVDDSVENMIIRIAQKGRAAGVHLVVATQRPSADVITGLMKANIPSRVAFKVSQAGESRIILDSNGAEKLIGKGDMLFRPVDGNEKRVQGCMITPEEIKKIIKEASGTGVENGQARKNGKALRQVLGERRGNRNRAQVSGSA